MKTTTHIALITTLALIWACGAASATTIIDQRGRRIQFPQPFSRIISLYGAHTENLFHMGAGHRLIGVSVNDTYPPQVREKRRFSYHDGPEKYLAARPDLVLIRPMIDNGYPKFVQQLESYGIAVVSLQPGSVDEMYQYWSDLGKLSGKSDQADLMVSKFKSRVAAIRDATRGITPKKRVYFQAIHKRMRTFTPGSMPLFALETAGGINVATDATASRKTNVAVYSKERILSKADRIDVFLAQKGIMNPVQVADILNEPGFQVIKAVRTHQVFLVDESIVSRPVPRLLDGVLTIGNLLYPNIFSQFQKTEDKL
jgi:iron complex transport system substrate-binding protein